LAPGVAIFGRRQLNVTITQLPARKSCRLRGARFRWRFPTTGDTLGTRLYVSNLPLSTSKEGLAARFQSFGVVLSVALETAVRPSGRGAFVEMETFAQAHKAIAALNLSDFDGRLVSVYLALAHVPKKP